MTESIQLDTVDVRHAAGPEDAALLWTLFAEEKAALLAAIGLSESQLRPLIEMQYRGRQMTYEARYPNAENWILSDESGTPAGRILVDRKPECWRIIDIALLAAYRGKGFGTTILEGFQRQCEKAGASMALRVDPANPARRLYERLGFRTASEDAVAVEMVWSASAPDQRNAVSE